ncbi:hypothetical protein MXB_932 [Myxobolus squamalis]|nr:hypothetical protein MXB_932 [Myxobolus squamalis]
MNAVDGKQRPCAIAHDDTCAYRCHYKSNSESLSVMPNCHVLHEIVVLLKYRWELAVINFNFEASLLKAASSISEDKEIGISDSEAKSCSFAVKEPAIIDSNPFNNLITYLKTQPGLISNKLPAVWAYFQKIWLTRLPPSLWNINNELDNLYFIEQIIVWKDATSDLTKT